MAFERLLAVLEARARRLAAVRAAELALARRDPVRSWRSAALLWPLFTKGSP